MERRTDPNPDLIRGVDPRFLAARGIKGLAEENGRIVVDMTDPDDAETVAALRFALRRPVVVTAADPVVAPVAVAVEAARPSLLGRLAQGLGDAGVARWVAVDGVAQLVVRGATVADAVARVRGDAPDAVLDRIAAGEAPEDWAAALAVALAVPGRDATMLTRVAGRMRFEAESAIAARRAWLVPALVPIIGLALVGWWGLLPAMLLPMARGAMRPLAVARRTGRAVAVREVLGEGVIPTDGLTAAERDRLMDDPDAVMHAVDARAMLAVAGVGATLGPPMLVILAILVILHLG
ncbi:MAG TPA: hypothetical protein VF649_04895 [Sphingomonas sp.]|jgi:hypothetical protein|uniref:GspE/PulE/PilB domain-containing protein n=1 Tax=Sphingomonas sp. TaxID=28214 RepID=UPI002EDA59F1